MIFQLIVFKLYGYMQNDGLSYIVLFLIILTSNVRLVWSSLFIAMLFYCVGINIVYYYWEVIG